MLLLYIGSYFLCTCWNIKSSLSTFEAYLDVNTGLAYELDILFTTCSKQIAVLHAESWLLQLLQRRALQHDQQFSRFILF